MRIFVLLGVLFTLELTVPIQHALVDPWTRLGSLIFPAMVPVVVAFTLSLAGMRIFNSFTFDERQRGGQSRPALD